MSLLINMYPISTKNDTYRVKVYKQYIDGDTFEWVVKIYLEVPGKKTIFGNQKYKKLYRKSYNWGEYRKWAVDLIGLIEDTVRDYETKNIELINYEKESKRAIDNLKNWDGRIN